MPEEKQPTLHADYFYKFFQCPHWIWYDIYSDAKRKKEIPPLLEMIHKGKIVHVEQDLVRHKKFEQIKPELFRDLDEAFLATLELMKKGENIYHGVLMSDNWVGIPDLLEARPLRQAPPDPSSGRRQGKPEKSKLGDWYYVVYDAQNSLDLKDEYKFQLIFYSLILERIQGVRPEEAYVIDPQGNERSFKVDDFMDQFHFTKEQIEKILNGEKPPPFLKSGCKRTPWYSLCLSETQGCQDVSLIYRISQADQRRLYEIGIKTVGDLASANVNDLQARLEDWPFDKIVRFSNQAKSLIENKAKVVQKPKFPDVRHEIFFDIESDPTRDIDYLLGFLVKDKKEGTVEYKYFFAEDKEHEPEIWRKFLDFLVNLEDFVIYHYAYYERQVFDRLVLRYGAPGSLISKFKENSVDLHLKLVDSVILPIYFYSLKDVGAYLGYKWDDPDAGGAESVIWYDQWIRGKDDSVLKKIIKYNEDDVRATMLIKEWLENQKPSKDKNREKLDELDD